MVAIFAQRLENYLIVLTPALGWLPCVRRAVEHITKELGRDTPDDSLKASDLPDAE